MIQLTEHISVTQTKIECRCQALAGGLTMMKPWQELHHDMLMVSDAILVHHWHLFVCLTFVQKEHTFPCKSFCWIVCFSSLFFAVSCANPAARHLHSLVQLPRGQIVYAVPLLCFFLNLPGQELHQQSPFVCLFFFNESGRRVADCKRSSKLKSRFVH